MAVVALLLNRPDNPNVGIFARSGKGLMVWHDKTMTNSTLAEI